MKEIGGYFELELPSFKSYPHEKGVLLNSGRHALEFILLTLEIKPKLVWVPYYTCHTVLQPLERRGIQYKFYHIDESFESTNAPILGKNEYIIVNNYFGLKDKYVDNLVNEYGDNIIIDATQSFYYQADGTTKRFYSPKKFFGVPDGGIAYSPLFYTMSLERDISYDRISHLLKRIDLGASEGYSDFKTNSSNLKSDSIKRMSKLAEALLRSIDYETVKRKRIENYKILSAALDDWNGLTLPNLESFQCPMVYPFYTENSGLRKKLIENKIFVATYWPWVLETSSPDSTEYMLATSILPLPIDQRYGEEEMERIVELIRNYR